MVESVFVSRARSAFSVRPVTVGSGLRRTSVLLYLGSTKNILVAPREAMVMLESLAALPTWVLSSAATRSHQTLHSRLAAAGASGYGYRCLTALAARSQMSQTELGEATSLDPRDVTHTVRTLEERGLVSRTKDPGHGRRILVSLTAAGHQTVLDLGPVMEGIQDEVFGNLSADERITLLSLLARVG